MKSKTAPEQDRDGSSETDPFHQSELAQDLGTWSEADEEMRRSFQLEVDDETDAARQAAMAEARARLDAVFPESKSGEVERGVEKLTLTFGAASASEGQKVNEDRFAYDVKGTIVVSDGVGSGGNGAEASQKTVDCLMPELAQLDNINDRSLAEKIMSEVLYNANDFMLGQREASGNTMAATVSAVKLIEENGRTYAVIGNVGDSPIYLLRDGELIELTNYHTHLPVRDKRQALGKPLEFKPNVFTKRIRPGDQLIVTSNGVRKKSPNLRPIQKLITKADNPQQAAQRLATELKGDSQDARTAVVLKAA